MSERDIFLSAIELTGDARRAFLDQACTTDDELRRKVEALFAAHEQAGNFLNQPAVEATSAFTPGEQGTAKRTDPEVDRLPGTVLAGRYKLLERIGLGGMGAVYVAEQTQPVRRKVAIKIIKLGMDTGQVLARFDAERQALAMMDHPNIAKVLDGGMTDDHRPYFVMEYVKGDPLHEFCDNQQLTVKHRLDLFIQICQAVQHAHQKGIIHRDLKPGNILVCLYDGKPVPKVIDFGLAKALHQPLTEHTLHTGHGMVLGTPLYMSPEQAEVNNFDVDTRTDIYALGVILYELLTGTTPLEKQRFRKAAWDEVLRIIREEEPPKPSTKLSGSNQLASLSAQRKLEPRQLTQLLTGDLDWIVMKALEKDRNRRYETANGFAMDIQRYLADEPVSAGPPGAGYRMRKFVKRNKGKVVAAALVLLTLLSGIAGTTWGLIRAQRSAEAERVAKLDAEEKKTLAEANEKKAVAAAEAERLAKLDAEAQKKTAEEEKAIATAVRVFLQDKLLGQADVRNQADSLLRAGEKLSDSKINPTIRELLDRAARQLSETNIEAILPNKPLIQAEILSTIGVTYRGIGEYEQAIEVLQRSLALRKKHRGLDHPETLANMHNLAVAYVDAGKPEQAISLHEDTLKLITARFGPEHRDILSSMNGLAGAYRASGKVSLALPLLEKTVMVAKTTLGTQERFTRIVMGSLALAYHDAGKLDLALPLYEEVLKLHKVSVGTGHPDTLRTMNDLAGAYKDSGKLDLALPLHEETLKLGTAKLGPDHPITLNSMNNLAAIYVEVGKLDLALPLFEKTLLLRKARLGPDHPDTIISMAGLGRTYQAVGKMDLALPLLQQAYERSKEKLGLDHPQTLVCLSNLALFYQLERKFEQALPLFEQLLVTVKAKQGADHPTTLQTMHNLAGTYWEAGKLDKALPLFEQAATGFEKRRFQHPVAYRILIDTIHACEQAGQFDKAEAWRQKWMPLAIQHLAMVKQISGAESPAYAAELAMFGLILLQQKKWTDAEPFLRESLTIREKTQPDMWSTFGAYSMLGEALLGQKKFTDAEPLLLKGYEGIKAREKTIPMNSRIRVPQALDRLIQFYTETNKPDEVKKWQAEKAKLPKPVEKKE